MKHNVHFTSFRNFLAALVLSSPALGELRADALAEFSGGLGEEQPNQFRGTEGAGWASAWEVYFFKKIEEGFTFDITKDPAFADAPDVLKISRRGDEGFARLERQVNPDVTDINADHVITFQIRADDFTGSVKQPFLFSIGASNAGDRTESGIQASAWTVVVVEKTSTWGIYHGEAGQTSLLNTRIPLELGKVYTITIRVMPATSQFSVSIQSDVHGFESPVLSSLNPNARSELLTLGGWVAKNGPGNFQWSLGPIKVAAGAN